MFEGRFGRMFRRLPAAPPLSPEQLSELAGRMTEPVASGGWTGAVEDFDNPDIPAGYTYFGQFLDHDITFDPQSSLDRENDPDALHDFRTPRFDLDSVYGSGPQDEPFQYQRGDPAKFLLGSNSVGEIDLPRNQENLALIGDPRNDENVIVSQLHSVFLRLHNKFVDQVRSAGVDERRVFEEAQRLTRWHYQWIVVHDYLPRIVDPKLLAALFRKDKHGWDIKLGFYRVRNRPYMPVEFSAAAFRFGHSMVRGIYKLNGSSPDRALFTPGDAADGMDPDLRGRRALPANAAVEWSLFFDIGGSTPQPSRRIDSLLVSALTDLPGTGDPLALRNLKRGQALQLPSGQAVAQALRAPSVTNVYSGADLGAPEPTPLWFYILKESELEEGVHGKHLGPVGGRIVAEVLLGLLNGDTQSYINQDPGWEPVIQTASGAATDLTLADLIVFATQT